MKSLVLTLLTCSLAFGLPSFNSSIASICHTDDEFACSSIHCIPLEFQCDNIIDCRNGQDEDDCHYLHLCPAGEFICRTGECLHPNKRCDGNKDCDNGADEAGCEHFEKIQAEGHYAEAHYTVGGVDIWIILFIVFLILLVAFLVVFLMREIYPQFRYNTDLVVDRLTPRKSTPATIITSTSPSPEDNGSFRNPTFDNPPLLLNA